MAGLAVLKDTFYILFITVMEKTIARCFLERAMAQNEVHLCIPYVKVSR